MTRDGARSYDRSNVSPVLGTNVHVITEQYKPAGHSVGDKINASNHVNGSSSLEICTSPSFNIAEANAETIRDSNSSQSPSYISTNDALSAFIFACITRARTPPERAGSTQMIPFVLGVSARLLLDIPNPAGYIGNMVIVDHLDFPLCTVRSEISCIASIAQQIRKRLIEFDTGHVMRWIGAISTVEDTREITSAFRVTKDYPFSITTWSHQNYYDVEWGPEVGGRYKRFRALKDKGSLLRNDGLVAVMPELKTGDAMGHGDGGLEVFINLEKGVMHKLRDLKEWTIWAEWRCS